jgi:hypothetical protein
MAMERFELKYLVGLVKETVNFISVSEKKMVMRDTASSVHRVNGVVRTPADSAVLRINSQP